MSLDLALRTALSGLQTSQQALQVTSNNIANVNTPGYHKKIAHQSAQVSGSQGVGTYLSEIERADDVFLTKEIRNQIQSHGKTEGMDEYWEKVQDLFATPGSSDTVADHLGSMAADLEALATTPENTAFRYNVIQSAHNVADRINYMSDKVQDLRATADQEIEQAATDLTDWLSQIQELNTSIVRGIAGDQPVGDLQDSRADLVNQVAGLLDINVYDRDSGETVIYTTGGFPLIDGDAQEVIHESTIAMDPSLYYTAPDDPTYAAPPANPVGGISGLFVGEEGENNDITDDISSGRLKALIDMRDDILPGIQSELDELAQVLRNSMNAVANEGSSYPAPTTLTGTHAFAGTEEPNWTGEFTVAVVDSNGEVQSSQVFDLDTYTSIDDLMTDIDAMGDISAAALNSSGQAEITAAGGNGVVFYNDNMAASNPAEVTVGNETRGLAEYLGLNDIFTSGGNYFGYTSKPISNPTSSLGITGSFDIYDEAGNNLGTITTTGDSLSDIATEINALGSAKVSAEIVPGRDGYRLLVSGSNNLDLRNNAGTPMASLDMQVDSTAIGTTFEVRDELMDNPDLLTTAQLGSATAGEVGITQGDDTNAVAMGGVFTTSQSFNKAGSLGAINTTLDRYAGLFVGSNANQAATAENEYDYTNQFKQTLEYRASQSMGVNVDQELTNIIMMQQSYQASARVVSTAQEMINTLMNLGR